MPLTTQQIQEVKTAVLQEIATLNVLSQIVDVLVAGSTNVDKEGRVTIALSPQQTGDLVTEVNNRNEGLKNITRLFDGVVSSQGPT